MVSSLQFNKLKNFLLKLVFKTDEVILFTIFIIIATFYFHLKHGKFRRYGSIANTTAEEHYVTFSIHESRNAEATRIYASFPRFVLFITVKIANKDLNFIQFSDLVRELTDFSKFMLIPNNFKEAEDHFIKVQ